MPRIHYFTEHMNLLFSNLQLTTYVLNTYFYKNRNKSALSLLNRNITSRKKTAWKNQFHLLINLPALSLFSFVSFGCLYKYMTAFPMPLFFKPSALMAGN